MVLKCDYFELLSDTVIAFIGELGSGGVLVYRESEKAWEFHPQGSTTWSDFHQRVFRNHRAVLIKEDELKRRGIQIPVPDDYADRPAMAWADNFRSELPLKTVPPSIVNAVSRGKPTIYVVLEEDTYETFFGDGKFLYPVAAFWSDAEAVAYSTAHASEWSRHTVRPVRLEIDGQHDLLRASLELQLYEHIDLPNVVKLLLGK